MHSPEPLYVELDNRIFTLTVVKGYPRDRAGKPVKVRIDLSNQEIEASEFISPAERAKLLGKAMGVNADGVVWRLVPCIGRIRAVAPAAS